ncbi:hypothetical protein NA57DRAFT_62246 [Rhizodiscina lignyota]|uniref:Uncharacterized protein n=1 Tax=Rhizodiscina lignyota TaxID=1504668 RepID=A0A9P4I4B1_9PEZI|nr:hypothetical protein NA57DRAFT_62246 [Rhizodiscina lignyota]
MPSKVQKSRQAPKKVKSRPLALKVLQNAIDRATESQMRHALNMIGWYNDDLRHEIVKHVSVKIPDIQSTRTRQPKAITQASHLLPSPDTELSTTGGQIVLGPPETSNEAKTSKFLKDMDNPGTSSDSGDDDDSDPPPSVGSKPLKVARKKRKVEDEIHKLSTISKQNIDPQITSVKRPTCEPRLGESANAPSNSNASGSSSSDSDSDSDSSSSDSDSDVSSSASVDDQSRPPDIQASQGPTSTKSREEIKSTLYGPASYHAQFQARTPKTSVSRKGNTASSSTVEPFPSSILKHTPHTPLSNESVRGPQSERRKRCANCKQLFQSDQRRVVGECRYHPQESIRHPDDSDDDFTPMAFGSRPRSGGERYIFPCCNGPSGSNGCIIGCHVDKRTKRTQFGGIQKKFHTPERRVRCQKCEKLFFRNKTFPGDCQFHLQALIPNENSDWWFQPKSGTYPKGLDGPLWAYIYPCCHGTGESAGCRLGKHIQPPARR